MKHENNFLNFHTQRCITVSFGQMSTSAQSKLNKAEDHSKTGNTRFCGHFKLCRSEGETPVLVLCRAFNSIVYGELTHIQI